MMNDELSPPPCPLPREGDFLFITLIPGVTLRSPPAVFWTPLQGLGARKREKGKCAKATVSQLKVPSSLRLQLKVDCCTRFARLVILQYEQRARSCDSWSGKAAVARS